MELTIIYCIREYSLCRDGTEKMAEISGNIYTHTYSYLVFLWLPTPSRSPKIVVMVENQQVAKLSKSASHYYI